MIFSCRYPDGSRLEIGSGNTHPPGWTGQHGNVNRTWIRINGGDWHPTGQRSHHGIVTLAGAAVNAAEAFEAICPEIAATGGLADARPGVSPIAGGVAPEV